MRRAGRSSSQFDGAVLRPFDREARPPRESAPGVRPSCCGSRERRDRHRRPTGAAPANAAPPRYALPPPALPVNQEQALRRRPSRTAECARQRRSLESSAIRERGVGRWGESRIPRILFVQGDKGRLAVEDDGEQCEGVEHLTHPCGEERLGLPRESEKVRSGLARPPRRQYLIGGLACLSRRRTSTSQWGAGRFPQPANAL